MESTQQFTATSSATREMLTAVASDQTLQLKVAWRCRWNNNNNNNYNNNNNNNNNSNNFNNNSNNNNNNNNNYNLYSSNSIFMITSQRIFQSLLLFCLYNKSLNDWSLGEQWILFPLNLDIEIHSENKVNCSPRDLNYAWAEFAYSKTHLRWFPSKRTHHRFPMKLGMLMLQDKEILKT